MPASWRALPKVGVMDWWSDGLMEKKRAVRVIRTIFVVQAATLNKFLQWAAMYLTNRE
jgi:hypothetical protein